MRHLLAELAGPAVGMAGVVVVLLLLVEQQDRSNEENIQLNELGSIRNALDA